MGSWVGWLLVGCFFCCFEGELKNKDFLYIHCISVTLYILYIISVCIYCIGILLDDNGSEQ